MNVSIKAMFKFKTGVYTVYRIISHLRGVLKLKGKICFERESMNFVVYRRLVKFSIEMGRITIMKEHLSNSIVFKGARMAPVTLEGPSLGHKHRNYNRILKKSIADQTADPLKDIDFNEDDVNNLIKVDIASINRNVDYILGVLKGNDMLYVSRAIARCPWLITDNTYAHIVNPEYLFSHLLPNMMAKAGNKLIHHIRLTLRDETRVESFFNYYEPLDLNTALKWLPHCSAAFMETIVTKYPSYITPHLLKRLCEKSHRILEVLVKSEGGHNPYEEFQETMFLLNTHTDFYLDLLETRDLYAYPKFNAKCTKLLMKTCPERIHKNFYKYGAKIHIPTFVKFLDASEIRNFLIKQANNIKDAEYDCWINLKNVRHFLNKMPQEERLKFITDIYIKRCFTEVQEDSSSADTSDECIDPDEDTGKNDEDIGENDEDVGKNDENSGMTRLNYITGYRDRTHELLSWYKCLPFDVALAELKQKMKHTKEDNERNDMIKSVTWIVNQDLHHLEEFLQYYNDNHLKDSIRYKLEFINALLKDPTKILYYESKSWGLLMNILKTIEKDIDETKCNDQHQTWVEAILVHEVINEKEVPTNIRKHFHFGTLKEYQRKMNLQQKTLLFEYLYYHLLKKIELQDFDAPAIFDDNAALMNLILKLLNDWQKNLGDNPYVLKKIKQLIKTKQDNSLNTSLAWIYDVNKSWRKCLFEESIILCGSDRVCVNALKHDAGLLSRNEGLVETMRCSDTIPLRQLLIKVKVYWADSLGPQWSLSYREKLAQPLGHKAIIRGLSFLLPQQELSDIINAYKPGEATINWNKDDEILISLRKHIAKNMHFARPQPSPDHILQYAKGDYLQFALPSVNAICYNLCATRCYELIPKMLSSPVSLQKHVIRLAFTKMQSDDLRRIFCGHWKKNKNLSIRAVLFKLTYDILCKEKNPTKMDSTWGLLKVFMDELSFEEDKTIYECLGQVDKVPLRVRPFYLQKSYTFLKALLPKTDIDKNKYEQSLESMITEMNRIVDVMEPEFLANILQEYFMVIYMNDTTEGFVHKDMMPLLASYLSRAPSEQVQAHRYNTVLLPLLKRTVTVWATKDKNDIVKTNLKTLLKILRRNLKWCVNENKFMPVTMYSDIQKELERSLDPYVAYLMMKEWKMTVAFAKLLNDVKDTVTEDKKNWDALREKIAPQFGKICLEFLREDIKRFFPCIDEYFSMALNTIFNDLFNINMKFEVLKHILSEDLIQSYLVTIRTLGTYYSEDEKNKLQEIHKVILSHPSLEVKMHFYHNNKQFRFKNLD